MNMNMITATENACFHLKKEILILLSKHLQSLKDRLLNASKICHQEAVQFLKTTQHFFNSLTFTVQEATDVLNEFKRCTNKIGLIAILVALDPKSEYTCFEGLYEKNKRYLDDQQQKNVNAVISLLFALRAFSNEDDVTVKDTLKTLNKDKSLRYFLFNKAPTVPDIINCSNESWFRCPQGHISPCSGQLDRSCRICVTITSGVHFPNRFPGAKFKGKRNNTRFSARRY